LDFVLAPDGLSWPNPAWSTFLLRSLIRNESFRNSFINTFADQLNTQWKPNHVKQIIEDFETNIEGEILHHLSRWNGNNRKWGLSMAVMKNFAKIRPEIMYSHIKTRFNIPDVHTVTVSMNDCLAGNVQINSLIPNQYPWEGIYFEGVPIRLMANPNPGCKFIEWQGDVISSKEQIDIILNRSTSIKAMFEVEDKALYSIIINEINYKPSKNNGIKDWVELYNRSDTPIDISNWVFKDDNELNEFRIPQNTIISDHGYIVLCRDMKNFRKFFSDVNEITGDLEFGLSSSGECLKLFDSKNKLVDKVCYKSAAPWPEPNGNNTSIALVSPYVNNNIPSNWFTIDNGSPGTENSAIFDKTNRTVHIYPNPAQNHIIVELVLFGESDLSIEIYDIFGRKVDDYFFPLVPVGKQQLVLDFNKYMLTGLYILEVKSDDLLIRGNFMVER